MSKQKSNQQSDGKALVLTKLPRPHSLPCTSTRIQTGCGHIYVTVSFLDKMPFEVFATLGKAGGCASCQIEAITRGISTGLRYRIPLSEYVRQLQGIQCPSQAFNESERVSSCADAISKVLSKYVPKEGGDVEQKTTVNPTPGT